MKSRPPLMLQELSEVLRNASGEAALKTFLSKLAGEGSTKVFGLVPVNDAGVVNSGVVDAGVVEAGLMGMLWTVGRLVGWTSWRSRMLTMIRTAPTIVKAIHFGGAVRCESV